MQKAFVYLSGFGAHGLSLLVAAAACFQPVLFLLKVLWLQLLSSLSLQPLCFLLFILEGLFIISQLQNEKANFNMCC